MVDRLSKFDQLYRDTLVAAAGEYGLVGEFVPGHKHNKFIVILTDMSTVSLAVYKTPGCDAENYCRTLKKRLSRAIMENLRKRGIV